MKKILYILLTLSVFSTGCSKEDDNSIQPIQETSSFLDENLYGIWKDTYEYNFVVVQSNNEYEANYQYYRSFSSNGTTSTWTIVTRIYSPTNELVFVNQIDESIGTFSWYVQDNYLFIDRIYQYNLSGNNLTITIEDESSLWVRQ